MKVFIGAGHGGRDPGACAGGFLEKDLNLSIALACRQELQRHGITVCMSRTADVDEALSAKIAACNACAPELALDIHCNAGGGDGAEVYHSYLGGTGKTLAVNILEEVKAIGQNSRGAKTRKNAAGKDYYGFIRQTACPAVIAECAFMDTPKDLLLVNTAAGQQAMGIAIAKGILKTLGVAWKAPASALYRVQLGAYRVKANAEKQLQKARAAGFSDAFILEAAP